MANQSVPQLKQAARACIDDRRAKKKEHVEVVGGFSSICAQIALPCLYPHRSGRSDIFLTVNKLARAVIKRNSARDQRWARLIGFIALLIADSIVTLVIKLTVAIRTLPERILRGRLARFQVGVRLFSLHSR